MNEMASNARHSKQMAEWSQDHALNEHKKKLQRMTTQKILSQPGMREERDLGASDEEQENTIVEKFRESVVNSGVRVVPGDSLGVHHKIANFWQENPFKILVAIGGKSIFDFSTDILLFFFFVWEYQQVLNTNH